VHVPFPVTERTQIPEIFCSDGFHPSAKGYEWWSAALAEAATPLVRPVPRKHQAETQSEGVRVLLSWLL
jgi:hypothetical protein